jgi:hypothetical protein
MIKTYRKKPELIDAVKFEYTGECIAFLEKWLGESFISTRMERHPGAVAELHIGTLEDGSTSDYQVEHIATQGDFIIKGVEGEFYPCKPDIFMKTYEEVPEQPSLNLPKTKYKGRSKRPRINK